MDIIGQQSQIINTKAYYLKWERNLEKTIFASFAISCYSGLLPHAPAAKAQQTQHKLAFTRHATIFWIREKNWMWAKKLPAKKISTYILASQHSWEKTEKPLLLTSLKVLCCPLCCPKPTTTQKSPTCLLLATTPHFTLTTKVEVGAKRSFTIRPIMLLVVKQGV